jgi:hypothetical protein
MLRKLHGWGKVTAEESDFEEEEEEEDKENTERY